MAIFSQGASPAHQATPWGQALDPIAQALSGRIQQNRAQQANIQQGSFLQNIIQDIASKGDEFNMNDVLQAIAKQQQRGYRPEQGPDLPGLYGRQFAEREKASERRALQEERLADKRRIEQEKKEEALAPYRSALGYLKEQRKLVDSGYLGPKLAGPGKTSRKDLWASPEGVKARSEYERLGKALISMASNIPIRNRQEFETLAHGLIDPTLSREEIEGALNGMEKIIKGQLKERGYSEEGEGGGIPGSPEVLGRSQSEKTKFTKPRNVRKKSTNQTVPVEAKDLAAFVDNPDYEILEEMNQ